MAVSILPWLSLVLLLLLAHVVKAGLGFHVWPVGEARNWSWILQNGPGAQAAGIFWNIDGRNPLSPWWYIALRPLFDIPAVFLLLQLGVSLFIGVCAYLLVSVLSPAGSRLLPVAAAMLTSLFFPSIYWDGVIWNFVGALGLTLLCIWAYVKFAISGARTEPFWYGLSLALWLAAIGTYTIQSGAIFGIAILSLLHGSPPGTTLARRLGRMILDVVPYGAIFVMFYLIWRTTFADGVVNAPLHFSLAQLGATLMEGLWNANNASFFAWALRVPPAWLLVFLLVPALVTFIALVALAQRKSATVDQSLAALGEIAVVALCVVLPTILLEASSGTWVPGTRWPMVAQFWTPLLVLLVWTLVLRAVPASRARTITWALGVALFAGISTAADAGINRLQIVQTAGDRAFFSALRPVVDGDIASGVAFPRYYLIRLDAGASTIPADGFSNRSYMQTLFPGYPPATYHFMLEHDPRPPVVFGEKSVGGADPFFSLDEVPYASVSVLGWNGTSFTSLSGATAKDFAGLDVTWNRTAPLP